MNTSIQPASSSADAVRLTWMGTAGCHITDGNTAFYIDPFVSRYNLLKVFFRFPLVPRTDLIEKWFRKTEGAARISAVIVGHSHYDHAMDAPFFASRTAALLVGSESTACVGRGAGLADDKIRMVTAGDTLRLGLFQIHFLKSQHGPALFGRIPFPGHIEKPLVPPAAAYRYRLGETFTLFIEHPKGTFVHNGSAGYIPGMFDKIKADVILQGIAGRKNTPTLFENIFLPLKAPTVIPIHYDDFFSPIDKPIKLLRGVNLEEFKQTARGNEKFCRVRWVSVGEPVVLFS